MIDLFGYDTIPSKPSGKGTILQRWTRFAKYRKADPGTGVKCKFCHHSFRKKYSNAYWKCGMIGHSHSVSTDIRANHVCTFFRHKTK
jgi:hypothetical protein